MSEVFDIEKYDENNNYAIEASAGTGKTYNIVEIVKKLVEKGVKLENILVVTYTEKAAGELKDRIRGKLTNQDVDNASIYTIHSFCQNVISEFSLSSSKPMQLDVIDENEIKKFIDEFIRDNKNIKEDIELIVKEDESIDKFKNLLFSAVDKYYLDYKSDEDSNVVSIKDKDSLLSICYDCLKNVGFDSIYHNYENVKEYYDIISTTKYETKEGKKFCELAKEIQSKCSECFSYDGNAYKRNKKINASFPELGEAMSFFSNIKEIYKNNYLSIFAAKYAKDLYIAWQNYKINRKVQTFNDMIRNVREEVLKEDSKLLVELKKKYKYGILDEMQDTNQKQWDIFKKMFLCEDHHVVVVGDSKQSIYSFQGADIEVFKQVIDDINNYGDSELKVLETNYRSTENLINGCNEIFNTEIDNGFFNDSKIKFTNSKALINNPKSMRAKYKGNEDFPPIRVVMGDEFYFADQAIHFILDICSYDDNKNTNLQVKEKDEWRNITFKDIAILARTRSEMEPIVNALNRVGIPTIRYKDDKLFYGKECADWISLLEAINVKDFTGTNRKYFKKMLYTRFFGKSLMEINDEKYNKDSNPEMYMLVEWKKLASLNKWDELIDRIIVDSEIELRMANSSFTQSLSLYLQIADYCADYLSNNHMLYDLIKNLKRKNRSNKLEDDDENNDSIVGIGSDYDSVQVMTIHASKGLGFPVVISCAGFKELKEKSTANTYHDASSNKLILSFRALKEEKEMIKKELHREWMRLFYVSFTRAKFILMIPDYSEKEKDLNNANARLNFAIKEYKKNHQEAIYNINNIDFNELKEKTKKILEINTNMLSGVFTNDDNCKQKEVLKKIIREKENKKTRKHAYVSLSHSRKKEEDPNLDDDLSIGDNININKEGETNAILNKYDQDIIKINGLYQKIDESIKELKLSDDFPKGKEIGTTLHEILEHYELEGENLNNLIDKRFKTNGFNLSNHPEWKIEIVEMLKRVTNAKLPEINGNKATNNYFKLKDIPNNCKKAEIEFNFNMVDKPLINYCNGFVDLVFKRTNSEGIDYYSILDWKSDAKNDDNLKNYDNYDDLKVRVDEHYAIQRVLYSYELVNWLSMIYNQSCEDTFNNHFGGVYYVFIRGCIENYSNGIYAQTWDSYDKLKEAYNKILVDKGIRG